MKNALLAMLSFLQTNLNIKHLYTSIQCLSRVYIKYQNVSVKPTEEVDFFVQRLSRHHLKLTGNDCLHESQHVKSSNIWNSFPESIVSGPSNTKVSNLIEPEIKILSRLPATLMMIRSNINTLAMDKPFFPLKV